MAQASNYQRLRQVVGQAVQIAMDLRLHESDAHLDFGGPDGEWRRDMRRRTWWYSFGMLCYGSLVSGTVRMISSPSRPLRTFLIDDCLFCQLPSIHPYDTRVTAEYPVCHVDSSVRDPSLPLKCRQSPVLTSAVALGQAWPNLIKVNRQLIHAFEVMVALDHSEAQVPDPVRVSGPPDASPPLSDDPSVLNQELVAIDRHVLEMLQSAQKISIA